MNKSIYLSKKEIKEPRFGYPKHFYKCFDNKNGNILTQEMNGIIVWKPDKKNNFTKEKTIDKGILSLYDINESLFCFQDRDYKIYFYDSENYHLKRTISYNAKINLIGTINNESIVFSNNKFNAIIIVDAKYLEIIHVIECNKYYPFKKLKNNELLLIDMEQEKNAIIHKSIFDPKEKMFKNSEIIKKTIDISFIFNILITDNGYVVLTGNKRVIVLNV